MASTSCFPWLSLALSRHYRDLSESFGLRRLPKSQEVQTLRITISGPSLTGLPTVSFSVKWRLAVPYRSQRRLPLRFESLTSKVHNGAGNSAELLPQCLDPYRVLDYDVALLLSSLHNPSVLTDRTQGLDWALLRGFFRRPRHGLTKHEGFGVELDPCEPGGKPRGSLDIRRFLVLEPSPS